MTLTAIPAGREAEIAEALRRIKSEPVSMSDVVLPVVVLAEASQEEAEAASALLRAAGGTATVEDVWTTRERAPDIRARPECPSCGSAHVQPFTHAGPAARVNMKCRNCGHLFRSSVARR